MQYTTYEFYANFAVAFGEGPATIARIWGDSKLIYDPNPAATSAEDVANYPAWSSAEAYITGNEVSYAGLVWECIVGNTGEPPNAPSSTYWLQISDYPLWNSTTNYQPGDVVTYNGVLFVCVTANSGHTPAFRSAASILFQAWGDWAAVNQYYGTPTVYPGNQTQDPDPLIQASEGAAYTPGFRGLCYIVWENFPLANFGNRIPNIRAEVTYTKVNNVL